jgi:hypothetical protein
MTGEDPAEHQIGALGAEALRGEPHRRRHGRDPVEAVEQREQRQAVEREIAEGQGHERQSTQPVIPEQEPAIVVAVGQPAGRDRACEIEHAHGREQARGLHLRDAEIEAHRNEMHLNQAVGRGATDEEGREQNPERSRFCRIAQRAERGGDDRRGRGRRHRQRFGAGVAEWPQTEIARTVAHQEQHQARRYGEHGADQRQRNSPAEPLGEAREQRKEQQLPGRDAGGQDSDHEPAPRDEPARGNGCTKHRRCHAGADADHDAPEQHQLPDLRHGQ